MKGSQFTELLANIRATLVSFFSIVMFVSLGVGLFLGIQGSATALENAANHMFEDNDFHDFEVIYPYGLSDADVDALKRIDGVDEVVPTYITYPLQEINGSHHTLAFRPLDDQMDRYVLKDGALPTAKGQVAIGDRYAARFGIKIGDTITLVHDATAEEGKESDPDGMRYLTTDTFTVTGTVGNPNYISQLGSNIGLSDKGAAVETFGCVTADSFDDEAFEGLYPCVLIRSDSLRSHHTFSDEYKELCRELKAKIAEVGEPRATARFNEIKGEAQAKIDEATAQIEEGEKLLEDANKTIADGEKAIADGERQLDIALAKLESGQASYAQTKQMGDEILGQMQTSLSSLQGTYNDASANLASKEAEAARMQAEKDDYENTVNRLETLVAEIDQIHQQYEPYEMMGLFSVDEYLQFISDDEEALAIAQANLEQAIEEGNEEDIAFYEDVIEQTNEELARYQSELESARKVEELNAQYQEKVRVINELSADFNNNVDTRFPDIIEALPYDGKRIVNFPTYSEDIRDTTYSYTKAEADEKIKLYRPAINRVQSLIDRVNRELATIRSYVNNVKTQLDSGWAKYYSTQDRLNTALANSASQISEGQAQVSAGQQTLDQKKTELEEGKKTVEEKGKELEEGKAQLEESKAVVDALSSMNWIVNTRFMTSGTIVLANILSLTKNLRVVMASLFVIVGLLVCYSALSRIVHEQVRQIGTKKALGFREGEITVSYLAYTALAVLVGILVGILVSLFVVQGILIPKLANNFDLPKVHRVVDPADTAIISVVEMVLLLVCTWLACHSILKRNAVDLLAGEQTVSSSTRFYERWAIWKKLPLMTQMVINNCLSDTRRIFGTLIGVAGCTALIITAATLDGNINRSIKDQFGVVYDYDVAIGFDTSDEEARSRVEAALDKQGCTYAAVQKSMFLLEDEDVPAFEDIYIPESDEDFIKCFHLNVVPVDGQAQTQGVWISQAHADHRGLKVGDHLDLCTVTGERYSLTIAGFFTYYLPTNVIVMSPDYYQRVFEKETAPNQLLVKTGDLNRDEVLQKLISVDGFTTFKDEHAEADSISDLFRSVTRTVVAIYLALSALMAIIVLLNLDYMFIDEKKRELITLMINGFGVKDAKAYIYRDAIVMTIIGIILGIVVGIVMGGATVSAIEWQSCSFIKSAYLPGCGLGIAASGAFALIMMLIALRRIPRFSLTDIARY